MECVHSACVGMSRFEVAQCRKAAGFLLYLYGMIVRAITPISRSRPGSDRKILDTHVPLADIEFHRRLFRIALSPARLSRNCGRELATRMTNHISFTRAYILMLVFVNVSLRLQLLMMT